MCTTKVSEWVLLNTAPEEYLLVYHYNKEISEPVKIANKAISKQISTANVRFHEVINDNVFQPYYALYYKKRVIRKYDSPSELINLPASPLRERIAKEIMEGKLCVMLYLTTGNTVKDEKSRVTILETLDSSPFRNIITFIELNRKSVDESHFVSMLLNVEDDLGSINEPMLFGIFGRFKTLEPLLAGGISEENIGYLIDFLTADCSCLIKDDLPGTDILFTNNWENPVPALVNKILDENPSLMHR
jgi:hypothetical protein